MPTRRVLGYAPRLPWPKSTAFLLGGAVLVCLLGSQSHLSYLDVGPVVPIGWQAGEAAFSLKTQTTRPSNSSSSNNATAVDPDQKAESWSEWPDSFDSLSNNPRPITEVALITCTFPPGLLDGCEPSSTDAEDAVRGPWIRLDRDINKRIGLWYLYLFYRRAQPKSTSSFLTNLTVLTPQEAQSEPTKSRLVEEGWDVLSKNIHSGLWGAQEANLWTKSVPVHSSDAQQAFTELDIVYGQSAVRWGWEYVTTVSDMGQKDKDRVQIHGRRTPQSARAKSPCPSLSTTYTDGRAELPHSNYVELPPRPTLRFSEEGNFTALQLADLHFSVDGGDCRDIANATACPDGQADQATLQWLNDVIDDVQPSLVVLTGDQLNGQSTSWTAPSVIFKVASLFRDRQIPWTVVYGNHDSEKTDLDRSGQMSIYKSLPYFLGQEGPMDVDGVGNYVLPVLSADPSDTTLFNMWFLDSHAGTQKWFSKDSDYKPLTAKQIDWFNGRSMALQPILRPYKPADLTHENDVFGIPSSANKLIKLKRQTEAQTLKLPTAMAWFHIPVPEAYDTPDTYRDSDEPVQVGTTDLEGYSASTKNNDFFKKAILAQRDSDQSDAAPQVKVLAHGHSHLRDACTRVSGVFHCFSGGSSYSGYGMRGFDRRVRVYRISDYGETIATWKLLDGSGEGDRDSGEFDVLKAEQPATQQADPRESQRISQEEISEEQVDQEWSAIVNELKEEQETAKNSKEGDGLSELVDEIEKAEEGAAAAANKGDKETSGPGVALRRRQQGSGNSREGGAQSSKYRVLDFQVLVGQGARL